MNRKNTVSVPMLALLALILVAAQTAVAQSTLDCQTCHNDKVSTWLMGRHANTQTDVADELSTEWVGQAPDSVVNGSQAEDCVACHAPTAVAADTGMTETQVMANFFTTTGGLYTDSTAASDPTHWPHVACTACHDVPTDHQTTGTMPTLSIFNSFSAQYGAVQSVSTLCGQCHGTLRYADTDHHTYNAWHSSKHGHGGQADVASELAEENVGKTPSQIVEEENCVACHAPTAVTINGGMSEAEVLTNFFTTSGGNFTDATTPADTSNYPDVACNACHNPHRPDAVSYFNSTTGSYEVMASPDSLCGQCHGNLRFPDTDHLSYNILLGTGGIGVADQVTMAGITCVDCHMLKNDVDGFNSTMSHGHTWSVFVTEPDGSVTSACTTCHTGMTADSAQTRIADWKAQFATLDSIAEAKVAAAASILQGASDTTQLAYLDGAQHNLAYAESDESGGVHNHNYGVALLNDAIAKATLIISTDKTPTLLAVRDVPADQGGRVHLTWSASGLDTDVNTLTHYSVWRALPEGVAKVASRRYRVEMVNGVASAWEWLADVPALRLPEYAYTAATLYDSMSTTDGMHEFMIVAHTDNPDVFFMSEPASGYSVDNLAPAAPVLRPASYAAGKVTLSWPPNGEADLSHYAIYRSATPGINPDDVQALATTTDTMFTDTSPLPETAYYFIRAQDIHENFSPKSNEVEQVITDAMLASRPVEFALEQNMPNPFNPTTTIRFGLPEAGQVRLAIYDINGRVVRTLVDGVTDAGVHEIIWDGRDALGVPVASGVYVYRLVGAQGVRTRRMVLVR